MSPSKQMSTHYDADAREYVRRIILFVRGELKKRGLKQKEFAKRVGVTEGRMKAILNRSGNPQLSTLLQLSYGLGMPVEALLAAGSREHRQSSGTPKHLERPGAE